MSIYKPTRIQWLTALFPLPLVVVFFLYLLIDFSTLNGKQLSVLLLMFIPISFCSWYSCVFINNYITWKIPGQSETVKRGLVLLGLHFTWLILLSYLLLSGLSQCSFFEVNLLKENFFNTLVLGTVSNIFFTTTWQVEYIFKSWKKTLAEKKAMESELLQHEFDRLKQQLNPHFLFNNLNVLSSLISEEPQKASFYLDELSKIYRYLLRRADEDLATLEDELAFIRSYAALLKIRFGDAVQVELTVDGEKYSGLLPMLSLQLLVENAIKHNTAHKTAPLRITIALIDNYVQVRNNLQPKMASVPSHKVGLANIQAKYRMLNIENITVEQTSGSFEVRLPLIKPQL
jgi:two-component system LytT family sensor kinase